jgi:hypothetical protein
VGVEDKLDKIIEKQSEMTVTLAKMEVDLAHHIKRSDSHEERMDKQDKKMDKLWYVIIAIALGGAGGFAPELVKLITGAQ